MQPYARTYRSREVAAKIGTKNLYDATYKQLIPCVKATTRWLYDADYIDNLVYNLQKMYGEIYPVYDGYFARLFQLGHIYREYLATKKRRSRLPSEIRDGLHFLISNRGAYPLTYLAEELPAHSLDAVLAWAARGKLVTVVVCDKRYLSGRYARHIIWAMNECETVGETAERLGKSVGFVYRAISDGRMPAFRDVAGRWRIDPARVPASSWVDATTGVTLVDAAQRLGVDVSTIKKAIARGVVRENPQKKETNVRSMPQDEFQRWVQQFTTLQPGFEWLQAQIASNRRPPRTLSLERTARELGVGIAVVRHWCRIGLLPHFVRSFGTQGWQRRDLVWLYIFGLKRFTKAEPLRQQQVEAYAAACATARVVI